MPCISPTLWVHFGQQLLKAGLSVKQRGHMDMWVPLERDVLVETLASVSHKRHGRPAEHLVELVEILLGTPQMESCLVGACVPFLHV